MTMMKVLAYARGGANSVDHQHAAIRAYCELHGYEIIAAYSDISEGPNPIQRFDPDSWDEDAGPLGFLPYTSEEIAAASALVVTGTDRVTRRPQHLLAVANRLAEHGKTMIGTNEGPIALPDFRIWAALSEGESIATIGLITGALVEFTSAASNFAAAVVTGTGPSYLQSELYRTRSEVLEACLVSEVPVEEIRNDLATAIEGHMDEIESHSIALAALNGLERRFKEKADLVRALINEHTQHITDLGVEATQLGGRSVG